MEKDLTMAAIIFLVLLLLSGCGTSPVYVVEGQPGATGATGAQGQVGATGPSGARGTDGTSVTSVAFCPGIPGVEGHFQEYGLRTADGLFAVYSHGSRIFLTRLYPGTYITTDGRSCVFSVDANLEVIE